MLRLGLCVFGSLALAAGADVTVVSVTEEGLASTIAVQTCAGLLNRESAKSDGVFVLGLNGKDAQWLQDLTGNSEPKITPVPEFLEACMKSKAVAGYIRYNATSQQLVLPQIITVAGVLDAVLLEDGQPCANGAKMVMDATETFAGASALTATTYIFEHYVNQTTAMAKMNPGLDVHHGNPFKPKLTGKLDPGLIDFVVKERLFNFFMNDGCIPLTSEHKLMEKIVSNNPWPRPIPVYGYDDTFGLNGDLFEAETNCVPQHNMGQIASNGFANLAYFSRTPPITTPLIQNPEAPSGAYNASKTYIAFVVGDGDNMNFLKGSRRDWMEERVNNCQQGRGCFPLLWTISPRVLLAAPDMARWYYNQSYITKHDYFVLPPSGHLYAYPTMMSKADQASFVKSTEEDCRLLNTSGVVAWEWFFSWVKAVHEYFPQYGNNGVVRSLFAVNVPYNLPTGVFLPSEFYKVYSDKTVLFRPREWRGTSGHRQEPFDKHNELTAKDMAKEINGYPRGTVTSIYMTSDGGARMQDFYDLVAEFDEHVQVVSHTAIADMALSAKARSKAQSMTDTLIV